MLVIIEHMREDVLGILESLGHLRIVAVEGLVEGHRRPLPLFVNVGHESILGVQQDLCVVLEVNLDDLVRETEHYSVLGSHPLLHVNRARWVLGFVANIKLVALEKLLFFGWIVVLFKIRLEVLQQRHLLLELFREI